MHRIHLDGDAGRPNTQLQVFANHLPHLHFDIRTRRGFKSFRSNAEGIDSRFHRRNDEIPNAIGKSRLNNIGTCVGHGHGSAWHTRILRIDNAADEAALLYLRICEYGE